MPGPTLADLKARIQDDLARSDLASQIGNEIESAIEHFRGTRLYFTETRDVTFTTSIGQGIYTVIDNASIPMFFEMDDVFLTDAGQKHRLTRSDPQELEYLMDSSASSGRPNRWAWFDQSIYLYPLPDIAYSIRLVGAIERASPANDAEENNVWMTEAFELLRCRAKWYLYGHVINDVNRAVQFGGIDGMGGGVGAALAALRKKTTSQRAMGVITPTSF